MTEAILLVGPTGAGKTPLGEALERRGLWGRACRHFDFGERLRRVAAGEVAIPGLGRRDVAFLRDVLDRGALLKDRDARIAMAILEGFIATRVGPDELVVLNGLPRHASQADAVDARLRVRLVVDLACSADVVRERIGADAGGDRAGRDDDDDESIRRKIALFEERTAPLVERYRLKGVRAARVAVSAGTTAEEVAALLERLGPA